MKTHKHVNVRAVKKRHIKSAFPSTGTTRRAHMNKQHYSQTPTG